MNEIPYGYCQCGCGQKTRTAERTDPRCGHIKGEPVRFVRAHQQGGGQPQYDVDPATGCWVWRRDPTERYPRIYVPGGKRLKAHRVYYERAKGPVPAGLVLDHLCRNTRCVNPDHLEPVTQIENMRRAKHVKLTLAIAEAIRQATGVSRKELAERYGTSVGMVADIRGGKAWVP